MSRPKVGVLLAGCGVFDGAEIHEAVVTLLALDRAGAVAICIAPDKTQHHVVDHIAGQPDSSASPRNVLTESARIARGQVRRLTEVEAGELDALILPGGFGVAKNLCDFALVGGPCTTDPAVASLVRAVHDSGKPIGAMCIAPVVLASVLGDKRPRLTIGNDPGTASAIEAMGGHHVLCGTQDVVIDQANRLVTTPAYMLAAWIAEAAIGIDKLVAEVLRMIGR
jgi:enhancing lycopene biosynthesis protein 2